MKTYLVGGAVRDRILGLKVHDRDFVVTGATPEMMLERGFRQVGKDFPVFLHPETHEEYALARTEKKSGHGYGGFICDFSPDITIEEDLSRRDLTINAMAMDEDGNIVDPWGGMSDLKKHLLRHTSPAFEEDVYEALVAALFLDGGEEACASFIERTLFVHVDPELAERPLDTKSKLQQYTQHTLHCAPEYQLIDDENFTEMNDGYVLEPWQKCAVDYAMYVPDFDTAPYIKPAGEWNTAEIVCKGNFIQAYVNGVLMNEAHFDRSEGPIALQSEGGPLEIRNVFLTPLKD